MLAMMLFGFAPRAGYRADAARSLFRRYFD